MSRPKKSGIDYFPLDVTLFSDPKIKKLKARYGVDGIAVYIYLLCEIYRSGYYIQLDEDSIYIFSDDLKMSSAKVMQVLNFLLERSLFERTLFQSDKVLTSAGIQRRFQMAVKERAKKNPIQAEGFWLLGEEDTEPFIKVNSFLNNSGKPKDNSGKKRDFSREESLKESKEKERKENKSKYISPELQSSPGNPVYELPLVDGTMHPVWQQDIEKFGQLYPGWIRTRKTGKHPEESENLLTAGCAGPRIPRGPGSRQKSRERQGTGSRILRNGSSRIMSQ